MPKKVATILQYAFFLGLGIFLVWWSIKDLTISDKQHISQALSKGKFWFVLPGVAVLLFSHWVRALRWRLIIEPLGYKPSKLNTFFAVMIGYLANQAVPRLGEVLRCSTLTRYEKIPIDKLIGTVILERLIDIVCLFLLFCIALLSQPDLYQNILTTFFPDSSTGKSSNLLLYAGLTTIAIFVVVFFWMIFTKRKWTDLTALLKKIIFHIWQGFISIRSLKRPWAFIFYTIVIWTLYIFSVYIGFLMLEESSSFGFEEAITVLCAGSLGMIATPGGVGAYAFLVQKTMSLYHLNVGVGLALGWLLWILQVIVILIVGGISLLALPFYNKNKSK